MDTITITAGRPNRQGNELDFAGPDGTYTVRLSHVSELTTEKSTLPEAKRDTWSYRYWTLTIVGGEQDGRVIDIRVAADSTGPKSRQYGLISAFFGKTPPVGTEISIQNHLIGRQALAAIKTNEGGYPYVDAVMSLPPAAAPAAPAAAPAAPAAASNDGLPF